jgi:hypothetical protein
VRLRVEYSPSNTSQWASYESQPSPQLNGLKKLSVGIAKGQGSPTVTSPAVLPGYRDSILNGVHNQTVAWRDGPREDKGVAVQPLPRMATSPDARRSSYTGPPPADPLNLTGSLQHAHRTGQRYSQPPPLPSSESIAGRSSGSSVSTNSSIFYSPRTPIEPSFDRALPMPTLYSQKSNGGFDNPHQLPPLRPPSLSPQTSALGSQQSPNGTWRKPVNLVAFLCFNMPHNCTQADVFALQESML